MLKRLLDKLENPNRPLLGPNVKCLELSGLLLPDKSIPRFLYVTMHLSIMIFVVTEFVDVWFIRSDVNRLLTNFKYSLLSTISVFKVSTFLVWQKYWREIIECATKADLNQRAKDIKKNNVIIKKNTKYCRTISYLYWFLTCCMSFTVILQPICKYLASPEYRFNVKNGTEEYLQVVNSWTPFDNNKFPGYLFASLIQTYASICATGWISSFDTIVIVLMVFFKGEIELLRRDCSYIFGSVKCVVSEEESIARIKEYHSRHANLLKYARLFDSCLSPIMLLYMFVCSVMLCATLYQITIETSVTQRFLTAEYLIFGIAQLFMYCWHSNDVYYMSMDLMLGPYESAWWTRDASLQRNICILIGQFKKTIVFTAGPFTDLTVATFIGILKGAYSYYTLLTQSQA